MRAITRHWFFGAIICCFVTGSVSAQDFPSRPITLEVGLAAGGITDVTARLYAEAVSKIIGQRVIIENRTGDLRLPAEGLRPPSCRALRRMGTRCSFSPARSMRPSLPPAMRAMNP